MKEGARESAAAARNVCKCRESSNRAKGEWGGQKANIVCESAEDVRARFVMEMERGSGDKRGEALVDA